MKKSPLAGLFVFLVALVALLFGYDDLLPQAPTTGSGTPGDTAPSAPEPAPRDEAEADDSSTDGDSSILAAFEAQRSDVWVESEGEVTRLLRDDEEGSRHQRFVLRLDAGLTLLVSHNLDIAPRVPLEEGDRVQFRGEYVWNEQGGILHWTHHDPDGSQSGGWIRHEGESYE